MTRKKAAKKAPSASTRLANIEKLVREGFQQVDRRFEQVDLRLDLLDLGQRDLRSEMNEKLALIDERINLLV